MDAPKLVESTLKKQMSYVIPKKPISLSQKMNIGLVLILLCIPFILYYFYKVKKTPKQKKKEIVDFVKYVKSNTKKNNIRI
mgnify:FL=1|jgi:hypothetical protein